MTLLGTPADSPLYDADRQALGYVANFSRVFALNPEVYAGWARLAGAVKAGMDERRYELVTLAAARRLGSAYCSLAHAAVLRRKFYDTETLLAVTRNSADAGLDPADVAIMDFAAKIATDPAAATPADIAGLRAHGLDEAEIFHVVAAVAARRFFTAVLAATHTEPDDVYDDLDPAIRSAL